MRRVLNYKNAVTKHKMKNLCFEDVSGTCHLVNISKIPILTDVEIS